MSKPEPEPKLCAAYQIKANPPHMGNLLELVFAMDKFDKIYVVIYDKPSLLNSDQCIELLGTVLDRLGKDKFELCKSKIDFAHMNSLPPDLVKKDVTHIITASPEVYSNLSSKNFPFIHTIPHAVGYYDDYQQIAYGRGFLLDKVRNRVK